MAELKDRYIRFDWAIKRLLRQKANFGVLEGFLTVFLNEEVKIIDILESEAIRVLPMTNLTVLISKQRIAKEKLSS